MAAGQTIGAPRTRGTCRRLPLAVLLVGALCLAAPAAGAGQAPSVTDAAGDANFVNGQGVAAGSEQGADTRPASLDGADLLAVWFTTAFDAERVVDAATGEVVRVTHRPTDLLVHVKTAAPVYPTTPPARTIRYRVLATLPDCGASFEIALNGTAPADAKPMLLATTPGCVGLPSGQGSNSPSPASFDGAVMTMAFPLDHVTMRNVVQPGAPITAPRASVDARAHISFPQPVIDEAAAGSAFIVGEDIPPDIDCTASNDPACSG